VKIVFSFAQLEAVSGGDAELTVTDSLTPLHACMVRTYSSKANSLRDELAMNRKAPWGQWFSSL
jgi:hypothetical protein